MGFLFFILFLSYAKADKGTSCPVSGIRSSLVMAGAAAIHNNLLLTEISSANSPFLVAASENSLEEGGMSSTLPSRFTGAIYDEFLANQSSNNSLWRATGPGFKLFLNSEKSYRSGKQLSKVYSHFSSLGPFGLYSFSVIRNFAKRWNLLF